MKILTQLVTQSFVIPVTINGEVPWPWMHRLSCAIRWMVIPNMSHANLWDQSIMLGQGAFVNTNRLRMKTSALKIWVGRSGHHQCLYEKNEEQDLTHNKRKRWEEDRGVSLGDEDDTSKGKGIPEATRSWKKKGVDSRVSAVLSTSGFQFNEAGAILLASEGRIQFCCLKHSF